MNTNRRKFLTSTGALTAGGLAGNLCTWGVSSAEAQALTGYKAIVVVMLFGGNDSNNMIIPFTDYAAYANVRTVASNVAIPQAQLVQFSGGGKTYGFHPSMATIAPLYTAGRMAVLANTGTLRRPIANRAAYQSTPSARPPSLFSHSDQQDQWNGLQPGAPVRTGWGGRFADKMLTANAGQLIPAAVSVSGSQLYTIGAQTSPLVVPQNGGVAVSGQGTDAVSMARYNALVSLLKNANPANQVVVGSAGVLDKALTANATANPILTGTLPPVISAAFTVGGALLNTGIAQQLRQVARLIEARAATGVKRQVFFVSMGGYDTHSNTINNQTNLFNQLFPAMKAFYDYTAAAGVSTNVTQVTLSDFNRTFIGNAPDVLAIRRYAGHHDPATRSTAITSLALYPDPKARAAIVAGLHDPAGMVRTAAAQAAAKGRVRDATESLFALLARGEESAAKALAQLADTELARKLADQLGKAPEATLALCLGQILLRADFGPDQSKVEVVRAIAKIQDAAAVTALTSYIDSPISQGKASRAEAEGIVDARLGGK